MPKREPYYPFRGPPKTIEEAFPDIEDVRVEVEEQFHKKRHRVFGKNDVGEDVSCCSNRLCNEGGFSFGPLLREMYKNKETEREDSFVCKGYENMGRWNRRHCANFFEVKVSIKYR